MKAKLTLEDGTEFTVTVGESEFKKETSKRWKPTYNDDYFLVDSRGQVENSHWADDKLDKWRYSQRNVFRTYEEAEQHLAVLKARAAILDHADEVNEGWVPDWSDYYPKYCITYDHANIVYGDTRFNVVEGHRRQPTCLVYYKTKQDALRAVNKVGDAYLTVLGVKKR